MQGRLQQISKALLRKTWPEYNDENPFKPVYIQNKKIRNSN